MSLSDSSANRTPNASSRQFNTSMRASESSPTSYRELSSTSSHFDAGGSARRTCSNTADAKVSGELSRGRKPTVMNYSLVQ